MERANQVVRRTFDVLDRYSTIYADLKVAIAGREGANWVTYSPAEYIKNTNLVSYGFLSLGIQKAIKWPQ
jgi:hypothetical protein